MAKKGKKAKKRTGKAQFLKFDTATYYKKASLWLGLLAFYCIAQSFSCAYRDPLVSGNDLCKIIPYMMTVFWILAGLASICCSRIAVSYRKTIYLSYGDVAREKVKNRVKRDSLVAKNLPSVVKYLYVILMVIALTHGLYALAQCQQVGKCNVERKVTTVAPVTTAEPGGGTGGGITRLRRQLINKSNLLNDGKSESSEDYDNYIESQNDLDLLDSESYRQFGYSDSEDSNTDQNLQYLLSTFSFYDDYLNHFGKIFDSLSFKSRRLLSYYGIFWGYKSKLKGSEQLQRDLDRAEMIRKYEEYQKKRRKALGIPIDKDILSGSDSESDLGNYNNILDSLNFNDNSPGPNIYNDYNSMKNPYIDDPRLLVALDPNEPDEIQCNEPQLLLAFNSCTFPGDAQLGTFDATVIVVGLAVVIRSGMKSRGSDKDLQGTLPPHLFYPGGTFWSKIVGKRIQKLAPM